ncbi:MAG: hypothetical protein V4473_01680 [Patescibacteria group bacterium]
MNAQNRNLHPTGQMVGGQMLYCQGVSVNVDRQGLVESLVCGRCGQRRLQATVGNGIPQIELWKTHLAKIPYSLVAR